MNSPKEEHALAMHSEVFLKTMEKISNRLFTKALELRRFEKHLPQLTYRKRAKVHRCTRQMLNFAIRAARVPNMRIRGKSKRSFWGLTTSWRWRTF